MTGKRSKSIPPIDGRTLTTAGLSSYLLLITVCGFAIAFVSDAAFSAYAQTDDSLSVRGNLDGRELGPNDRIELSLNREIRPADGRLAIFLGETDVTALFSQGALDFGYNPGLVGYATGDNRLLVYLVEPSGNWKNLANLAFKSGTSKGAAQLSAEIPVPQPSGNEEPATTEERTNYEFTPNAAINIKGQNQILTFPASSVPERNPFTDVDTQIGLSFNIRRSKWTLSSKFDLVGVGFRLNALRFGELQNKAPMFDLSSYLIELSKGRFKVNFGHVSFGSNRHLINSFSSRGVSATIPVGKQTDITLAAMNGTSIVGYDNFIGITRRKHNMLGAGVGHEFFKERPNGLRIEFTLMRGSLLPLSGFNQGVVNDAEKNLGFGFRVTGSDSKQRLRYDAGFTRSKFVNPADPLLEQGLDIRPVREVWRNARYAEISFDIFQNIAAWKEKKFKLTGTYRHEELEPLYRSIGVSTQADRRQNQFELSGSLGELTFAFGNLRDRDNLNDLASILKTLNRRSNVVIGIPLGTFFTPSKPIKWLPQISYSMDSMHQFGAFLPTNGEFRDLSQVPDQMSYAHAFNAQWIFSDKLSIGYRYTRGFQDNRQIGRALADFRNAVNGVTVGYKPFKDLDLDLEFGDEYQLSLEQPRKDRTLRVGTRGTWRTAFLKNSTFSGGLSSTVAGDTGNQSDARNIEFDAQWAYRFAFGTKKYKKLEAQFFIRYSNRYGSTIDRVFFSNNLNKTQAFNMGLTFNVF